MKRSDKNNFVEKIQEILAPKIYKPFMSITEEDLKFIINDIVGCKDGIAGVRLVKKHKNHFEVEITTEWDDGSEDTIEAKDIIEVYEPFSCECPIVFYDFGYNGDETIKLRKFCLEKGYIDGWFFS